jgi:hypothetical protein
MEDTGKSSKNQKPRTQQQTNAKAHNDTQKISRYVSVIGTAYIEIRLVLDSCDLVLR